MKTNGQRQKKRNRKIKNIDKQIQKQKKKIRREIERERERGIETGEQKETEKERNCQRERYIYKVWTTKCDKDKLLESEKVGENELKKGIKKERIERR